MTAPAPVLHKLQGFEIRRILRSQILDAPYNPRRISAGNRERLSKGLQHHKLVMPLVWNATTGNLVSGHQRLSILDEKSKGQEYLLDVASIEVPEKEEVELNIFLNNGSAMGEFDLGALKDLSQEFEFDLGDVGFSREDLYIDFGLDKDLPPPKSDEERKAITDRRNQEKQEYRQEVSLGLSQDGAEVKRDYVLQIVFPNNLAAHEFLRNHGMEATKRLFPADLFLEALGVQ
jgi:hypothetical protein